MFNFSTPKKEKSWSARRSTKPAQGALLEFPVTSVSRLFPVIAMAASAGGLNALSVILRDLPADFPAAIAIVMHVAPDHKSLLAGILKCRTHLQVTEAHTADMVVFLARGKNSLCPPVRRAIVCFSGGGLWKNAIAVVLTGGDGDGSFGVQIIMDKGGMVIAPDQPTSKNFSRPETSIQTGDVAYQIS